MRTRRGSGWGRSIPCLPAILVCIGALGAAAGAWAQAAEDYKTWSYSRRIGFNTTSGAAAVAKAVDDFPLLVRLSAPAFDFSKARSDGSDIRFADADGSPLAYQIERWNASLGKAEIWVKVPRVDGNSAADHLTLHWGKSGAASLSDGAKVFPAAAGFQAVWHFSEGGVVPRRNSVSSANPATPKNYDGDESRAGYIGLADSLDGTATGDYLELGSGFADYSGGFSYSLWANPTGARRFARFLNLGNGHGLDNIAFARYQAYHDIYFDVTNEQETLSFIKANDMLSASGWQHLAVTVKGRSVTLYKNGVPIATATLTLDIRNRTRSENYIGKSSWPDDENYLGWIDEPQLSDTLRSAEWMKLAYETQRTDSKFFALGPVVESRLAITAEPPASVSLVEGASLTLSLTAVSTRPIVYAWYRNGALMLSSSAGSTTVHSLRLADAGQWTCRVTDGVDTLFSRAMAVTVKENLGLWSRSMAIGLNTTDQGAGVMNDVTDFPLLIRLDAARFDFSAAAALGADLRLADASGNPLAFQIARWRPDLQAAEIWVRLPVVKGNADQGLVLYWGRSGVASQSDGSKVFPASEGWRGSWHLEETSGSSAADASGNGHHGALTGAAVDAQGLVGRAFRFAGGEQRVTLPLAATDTLRKFTFSFWTRETQAASCVADWMCPTLAGMETLNPASQDFWIYSKAGKLSVGHGLLTAPAAITGDALAVTDVSLDDGNWHHVAVTWDGANISIFEGGLRVATVKADGGPMASLAMDVGNFRYNNGTHLHGYTGDIDEFMITRAARSESWVELAYQTQRPDGRAILYGAAADLPLLPPTTHPASGIHISPLTVTLASQSAGAEIRYTLDGAAPSAGSSLYGGALTLTRSARVRAVAIRDGKMSAEAVADYTLLREIAAGGKDTLAAGDSLLLGDGRILVHPGLPGSVQITVEAQPLPGGVLGFDRTGPLLSVAPRDPAGAFPGMVLRGGDGPEAGVALFLRHGDGSLERLDPRQGLLVGAVPGDYFWGRDTSAPRIAWLGSRPRGADSLAVSFRVTDNVRNLEGRLRYRAGSRDSLPWRPLLSGDSVSLPVPVPAAPLDPVEVLYAATDRSATGYFPRGESRYFTLSRPLPAVSPLSLGSGARWVLAGLPVASETPLTLGDLARANGGKPFHAALWRETSGQPGTGSYRRLESGDALPAGSALWLAAEAGAAGVVFPATLSMASVASIASDSDGSFPIPLGRGWNLVANPSLRTLAWPVSRKDVDAYARSPVKCAHGQQGDGYAPSDSLAPWKGYYVFNHGGDTVIHLGSPEPAAAAKRGLGGPGPVQPGIDLILGDEAGSRLLLGARAWASEGLGVEDEFSPPPLRGSREGLWSVREKRALASEFIRWEEDQPHRWTVMTRLSGAVFLHGGSWPAGVQVWAVFPGRRLKLRLDGAPGVPVSGEDTLALYAGRPEVLAKLADLRGLPETPPEPAIRLVPRSGGADLLLALPGPARVSARVWRADGARVGGWEGRRAGAGWHRFALAAPGRSGAWARGIYWVDVEARGDGWTHRRRLSLVAGSGFTP